MDSHQENITDLSRQIHSLNLLLQVDFNEWSNRDKNSYGYEKDAAMEWVREEKTLFLRQQTVMVEREQYAYLQLREQEGSSKRLQHRINWEWKKEEELALDNGNLFFVNQTRAVDQLVKIHQAKFDRVHASGSGARWIIPIIADNALGLGKAAFAQQYILKLRELWADSEARSPFQRIICASHTVTFTFTRGELLRDEDLENFIIQ